MSDDAELLQAQVTALRAAIASGVLSIESDGERITYQSLPAMRAALADLEQRQAALAGTAGGRSVFVTFTRD